MASTPLPPLSKFLLQLQKEQKGQLSEKQRKE